jgi:hypothetical protein
LIGEKASLHVSDRFLKERLPIRSVELRFLAFEPLSTASLSLSGSSANSLPALLALHARSRARSATRYLSAGPTADSCPGFSLPLGKVVEGKVRLACRTARRVAGRSPRPALPPAQRAQFVEQISR